jgi:hypothetical protein
MRILHANFTKATSSGLDAYKTGVLPVDKWSLSSVTGVTLLQTAMAVIMSLRTYDYSLLIAIS